MKGDRRHRPYAHRGSLRPESDGASWEIAFVERSVKRLVRRRKGEALGQRREIESVKAAPEREIVPARVQRDAPDSARHRMNPPPRGVAREDEIPDRRERADSIRAQAAQRSD